MGYFEALCSPRPGEVRWTDIRDAVPPTATSVTVTIVDKRAAPLTTTLALTRRWAGGGWCRALACPRCAQPAGVLRVRDGELLCGRCRPSLTARQRAKNTRTWRQFDGELEHRLLRLVVRGDSGTVVPLGEQLVAHDAARATAAIDEAQSFLDACDAVIAARGGE